MYVNRTAIAALIRRDKLIITSYRLSYVLELFLGIVNLAMYFFISRTFEDLSSSDLGGAPTYFAFAAVGVIMGAVLDATSSSVGYRIREEQVTGTLEAISTAPITPLELCVGLVGFPFFFASARAAFYLLVAAILMDLDVGSTSWIGLALEGNGRTCSRDAVGTRVFASAKSSQSQMREVHAANGFSAQGDRRLLFGLGEGKGPLEMVVHWCGASEPQLYTLDSERYHRMRQP